MSQLKNDFSRVAEVELVYRNKTKYAERPQIMSSKDAYQILLQTWEENKIDLQEQFRIILLDRGNTCLAVSTISTGGVSDCMVDLKLVFATALKARATGIIIAHNHPSGNVNFSDSDKYLTRKISEAGKLLDISVHDHILVTKDGYASMNDKGIMPPSR